MNMEEVTGTHEACGRRRVASEEQSSSFEKMLSRLPWKYLFLKNACSLGGGKELHLLHKKLRL